MSSKLEAPPPGTRAAEVPDLSAGVLDSAGPRLPKDRLASRLAWGGVVSLLVNAGLWTLASHVVRNHILAPPPPLTFRRIILPPPPKPIHKPPKPKPKPLPKPVVVPKHALPPKPQPVKHLPPPPSAAHNRVLTANGPTQAAHTALAGGQVKLGQPVVGQNPGEGSDNSQPPVPAPVPPAPVQPKPAVRPAPPPPAPVPAGPTQDPEITDEVKPEIPDELKGGDYKSFVRVTVFVGADGAVQSVELRTSSGNPDIDARVVYALKHSKYRPALSNGQPVAGTLKFRYNFEVQ